MIVTTEVIGMEKLVDFFKTFPGKLPIEITRETIRTGKAIFNDYKRKLKKHTITGKTEKGAIYDKQKIGKEVEVEVGNTQLTGLFLEVGTKAHTITPKGKGWLVFYSEKTGNWVKTKKVKHPGTKANPYLLEAVIKWMSGIEGRIKQRMLRYK